MSAPHPRALLARRGLHPKKRFGQNFLLDAGATQRIADLTLAAFASPRRVLEIGAGTGVLTAALAAGGADVTALEIDRDLIEILRAHDRLASVRTIEADALTFDFGAFAAGGPWRAAGNLPYNVATPLVTQLVEMQNGPERIVVMVQKDVAERFAARPGTAAYGSLSIAVQVAMHVETAFTLAPAAFYPAPKVHSSVVVLERRAEPAVRPHDPALFRKVVRAAFAYRRKTLANGLALALGCERAVVERAIAACNLPSEQRGERLDLADFARLADALAAQ